jgi:hypothetical protein
MDSFGPEPMTDAELDREIAAAVNAEPSPAFVARVRQRVAQESERPVWSLSWSLGAACALAFAVVAAMIFRNHPGAQPQPIVLPIDSRPVAAVAELQADRRSGRFAASTVRRVPLLRSSSDPVRPKPDTTDDGPATLIDLREANALRALFAAASVGRIGVMPLSTITADTGSELTQPAEIVVPPLSIQPLAPEAGEGVRP